MTPSLIDAVVVALLIATCAYCYVLNRRLSAVRDGQASLETAIAAFDAAASKAQSSLHRIETDGATTGRSLSNAIERAEALAGDLSVMTAAGERVAGRLENAIADVRTLGASR